MTFRDRLAVTYAALFAACSLALGAGVYVSIDRVLRHQLDEGLQAIAAYHHTVWPQSYATFQDGQKIGPCVFYLEPQGRVVFRSVDAPPPVAPADPAFADALHADPVFTRADTPGGPLRVLLTRVQGESGKAHVIEVAAPLAPVEEALRTVLAIMAALGVAALGAALLVGRWLAGRAIAPIVDVTQAARALHPRDLTTRLAEPPRRDEIGELVAVFNQMLARLEQAWDAQQRFTADASHELRSPLTALRGELEVARRRPRAPEQYEAVLDSALEEIDRLERIMNDLLELAQGTDPVATGVGPIDLARLVEEVVNRRRAEAEARGLQLSLRMEPGVRVVGVAPRLARAVDNLLANALRYTAEGHVSVVVRAAGGHAVAEVTDTGPGIAADQLGRIFDRFHRADPSRAREAGGVGLGLAIAREIVRVHGGEVSVASVLGQGSSFTVRLPLAGDWKALIKRDPADLAGYYGPAPVT